MNPYCVNIPGYKEAIEKLPVGEVEIDNNFIEHNSEAFDELKEIFSRKGGVHLLSREAFDDEKKFSIIVRVPSKSNQEKAIKNLSNKKKTAIEIQTSMVMENLLYPAPDVVARWFEEIPGLPVAYANDLTDLAGTSATVIRKKL